MLNVEPGQDLDAEFRESSAQPFQFFWPVGNDYRVVDGVIRPMVGQAVGNDRDLWFLPPTRRTFYLPMGRQELPGEFAKLAGETEDKVLGFVRKYGLLGYVRGLTKPEAVQASQIGSHDPNCAGDPLGWFLAHADAVKLVMTLSANLNSPTDLSAILQQHTVLQDANDPGAGRVVRYQTPMRAYHHGVFRATPRVDNPRYAAMEIIRDIITPNLTGISRWIGIQEDGENFGLTSIFRPHNLLECIYWLLADAVTGGHVRVCEFCSRVFIAPDPRSKYCPPLLGQEISSCMNRAKQKKHREKTKGT